jgi:hypothetical protein
MLTPPVWAISAFHPMESRLSRCLKRFLIHFDVVLRHVFTCGSDTEVQDFAADEASDQLKGKSICGNRSNLRALFTIAFSHVMFKFTVSVKNLFRVLAIVSLSAGKTTPSRFTAIPK